MTESLRDDVGFVQSGRSAITSSSRRETESQLPTCHHILSMLIRHAYLPILSILVKRPLCTSRHQHFLCHLSMQQYIIATKPRSCGQHIVKAAILPMIYAITFIVSLSPFRSQSSTQCDMRDLNDGRTGSVLTRLFHVKISNFL